MLGQIIKTKWDLTTWTDLRTKPRISGERTDWLLGNRQPTQPSLCKVGSQRARVSLAQSVSDSDGLAGHHPPGLPFATGEGDQVIFDRRSRDSGYLDHRPLD